MDQARLDFLLSSWEARRMLPPPVLTDMRRIIGRRIVTAPPPRQQPQPSLHQQPFRSDDRGGPMIQSHPHQHHDLPNASRKRPFHSDGPGHFDQHPPQSQHNIAPGLSGPRVIRALIGEEAVKVDATHAQQLVQRLSAASIATNSAFSQSSHITAARLNSLLAMVTGVTDTRPPLPQFLTGRFSC